MLTLNDGKKIGDAADEAGFVLGFNKEKQREIKTISDVYIFLSQQTFQQRLSFYTKQVTALGYFEYDDCKFYPKERRVTFRSKDFLVDETSFRRGASFVTMDKKNSGILGRLKREISLTKAPQFVTATDRDVIFTLLNHYFGLRWTN